MRYRYFIATILSLLLADIASASTTSEQTLVNDDAGIFRLGWFAGAWTCTGTWFDLKTGNAVPVTGTWDFTYDCGHAMLVDKFTVSDANAPFTAWGWNSYDADTNMLSRHETDSWGTWACSETAGWTDDVIVWRGSMNTVSDGPYDITNMITRKAETSFWINLIVRPAGHARWFDAFKADCRRDPPWGR